MTTSERTRHIAIPYFFAMDRIAQNEVTVQHCPTGVMIADYFSKPLQGAKFRELRDQIMGVAPMPHSELDHRSVLELRKRKGTNGKQADWGGVQHKDNCLSKMNLEMNASSIGLCIKELDMLATQEPTDTYGMITGSIIGDFLEFWEGLEVWKDQELIF